MSRLSMVGFLVLLEGVPATKLPPRLIAVELATLPKLLVIIRQTHGTMPEPLLLHPLIEPLIWMEVITPLITTHILRRA